MARIRNITPQILYKKVGRKIPEFYLKAESRALNSSLRTSEKGINMLDSLLKNDALRLHSQLASPSITDKQAEKIFMQKATECGIPAKKLKEKVEKINRSIDKVISLFDTNDKLSSLTQRYNAKLEGLSEAKKGLYEAFPYMFIIVKSKAQRVNNLSKVFENKFINFEKIYSTYKKNSATSELIEEFFTKSNPDNIVDAQPISKTDATLNYINRQFSIRNSSN